MIVAILTIISMALGPPVINVHPGLPHTRCYHRIVIGMRIVNNQPQFYVQSQKKVCKHHAAH